MAKCREIRKKLDFYIDGELSTAESERVWNHIETCADCRQHWKHLSDLERMLAAPAVTRPPEGLQQRLMAETRQHLRDRRTSRLPVRLQTLLPRLDGAAMQAATAAVFVTGIIVGLFMAFTTSQRPVTASRAAVEAAQMAEAYQLDYLSSTPADSFTSAYLNRSDEYQQAGTTDEQ